MGMGETAQKVEACKQGSGGQTGLPFRQSRQSRIDRHYDWPIRDLKRSTHGCGRLQSRDSLLVLLVLLATADPQSLTPGYSIVQFSSVSISGCHTSTCLDPSLVFRAAMLSSCRLHLPLPLPDFLVPSNVHNSLQHARLLSFTLSQSTLRPFSVMFFRALMVFLAIPLLEPYRHVR